MRLGSVPVPRGIVVFAAMAAAIVCAGCVHRPAQGVLTPTTQQVEGTARIPVLVATTRKRAVEDPGAMFGGERADAMSYAAITVSIPPDRKVGHVQWPASLPGDPKRDFVTVSADYIDQRAFAASIAETARRTRHPRVLIFVHGFNNRFDDSVYRFAQIVHDSKAEAVPILFTWPSRGSVELKSYTYDRESANFSRDALEGLIDQIASYPHIKEIHLLAHSMGSYVTLEALRGRSLRRAPGSDKVKQAMLVAPDVDVDVFRATIKRMGPNRPKMLLFASQDDGALALSKEIWGGVARIGEVGATEPYRTEFERDRIAVYDLTPLRNKSTNAHSRAFDDIGDVMELVRQRNMQERGIQVARDAPRSAPPPQTETAALRD
jgi:esterase/lipase superfamily enzyme